MLSSANPEHLSGIDKEGLIKVGLPLALGGALFFAAALGQEGTYALVTAIRHPLTAIQKLADPSSYNNIPNETMRYRPTLQTYP